MSYIALYRKFRPDSFEEVKGQDHIVTTLRNQVMHDRVGHAYLFCGTRGTGKTTMAKLLAKTVNCENPTENGPCGVCESCRSIADGTSLNVIEIDAASNNGVDNIRQINEAVQYSPAQGKYLVYIIDEAHMLSKGATNAMLKTLEEPPEYVIFILATTDDQSLPITIKSRCQRYDFHRISLETITDRLEEIVNREGAKATRDALRFIARTADGSMRDALSILDECMSACVGNELDRESVLKTIGAVSVDIFISLLKAVSEDKPDEVLDIVSDTVWAGKDLVKFVDDFTWFLRNVLFLKISPKIADELDMTEETITQLIELGNQFSVETLTRYLNILQELCSTIRRSTVKRVTLEMALIRMMRPESDTDYSAVVGRLERLESGRVNLDINPDSNPDGKPDNKPDSRPEGASGMEAEIEARLERKLEIVLREMVDKASFKSRAASEKEPEDTKLQSDIIKENIRSQYPNAVAEDIIQMANQWRKKIIPQLDGLFKIYADQIDVEPAPEYSGEDAARLRIVFDSNDTEDVRYIFFNKEENRYKLADKLSEIIGKRVEIDISVRKGTKGVLDRESKALNKINFDNIEIKESED